MTLSHEDEPTASDFAPADTTSPSMVCSAGCREPEGLQSGFRHLESKDKQQESLSLEKTCSPEE